MMKMTTSKAKVKWAIRTRMLELAKVKEMQRTMIARVSKSNENVKNVIA